MKVDCWVVLKDELKAGLMVDEKVVAMVEWWAGWWVVSTVVMMVAMLVALKVVQLVV